MDTQTILSYLKNLNEAKNMNISGLEKWLSG